MNIDNSGHSWNPYSTFISSESKNSCQGENLKGFEDWPQDERVKSHVYVTECFLLEKKRPEVSLLNKYHHFEKY